MTPDKVEGVVRKAVNTMWCWVDDNQAGAEDFEDGYMQEFESILRTTLTQYHQDLMSEVVEALKELKTDNGVTIVGKYAIPHSCKEWQSALTEAQTIIKSK